MVLKTYYGAIRDTDFKTTVEACSSQDARYKIARAYRFLHYREKISDIMAKVISKRSAPAW